MSSTRRLAGLFLGVVGLCGCSTPSGSGNQNLTAAECRRYFEHTY
jgi:hypothetical protein